jgi:hypothetical protein
MSRSKLTIIGLVVVLVASNAWWAYRLLDAGISQTYLGVSLEDNKEALNQALMLLPVVAQANISRERIISAARPAGDSIAPSKRTVSYGWARSGLSSTVRENSSRLSGRGIRRETVATRQRVQSTSALTRRRT